MNASHLAHAFSEQTGRPEAMLAHAWELLEEIKPRTGFPHQEVEAVDADWVACAPLVLEALERTAQYPELARDNDYMAHLFAMFLAARHRERRAHDALIAFALFPEEIIEDALGDIVTDGLGRCLASTCDGDDSKIKSVIENESAYIWSRVAGMSALMSRVMEGDAARSDTAAYLLGLAEAEAERRRQDPKRDDVFLTSLANNIAELALKETLPALRGWYEQGLVDPMMVDLDDAEDSVELPFEAIQARARHDHYVHSVSEEMAWWDCFNPVSTPSHSTAVKVGRNEPCPCGSGKKFKKCCLE